MMELHLLNALTDLVAGRVFANVAKAGTAKPFITYQAIGGQPINYTTGEVPDRENTRVQINVWASAHLEATTLGKQVESALRTSPDLQAEVLTGRAATYDETVAAHGTMQDFSFWN